MLFAGVSVDGAVNVPDFTSTELPDSDESSEDPPTLPVTRDTYIVLPLPTGLKIIREMVAKVRPSTTKAEFEPFTLYKLPPWLALLSGGEMIPGDWYVFIINPGHPSMSLELIVKGLELSIEAAVSNETDIVAVGGEIS